MSKQAEEESIVGGGTSLSKGLDAGVSLHTCFSWFLAETPGNAVFCSSGGGRGSCQSKAFGVHPAS